MTVRIIVPSTNTLVQQHNELAEQAVAAMSPSRSYGAEINLSSWRRRLTIVDPNGVDGYAFSGDSLRPGAEATVPLGGLILSVDTSWAKARWYAGQYIQPLERWAVLYVAEEAGLESVMATGSRRWVSEILGFLSTNPGLCDRGGVAFGAIHRNQADRRAARW